MDGPSPGVRVSAPNEEGKKVDTSQRHRSLQRYAENASIDEPDRGSPHTLRRTFTTGPYRDTGKIRMVQKALGHSGLSTTMVYTHVAGEELEGAMKNLKPAMCPDTGLQRFSALLRC